MVSVLISATRSGWIDTVYGPMSAGLSERALGDLCVSENGVQTGPFGSQLHKRDYVNIGTPIITVEHLGENRIIHETMPRVSDEDKSRLSKYVLRDGDIVFSRVGSVDRRSLVRKEEDGWLFSGRCLRVRPDRNKIDPVFLSYFLGLPSFKEHIRSIAVGATMPSLNTKILNDVTVYFPTLPEQRRIAHILGTLDDKIELNRRMNETLEEMARAIFKDWFVDFGPVRAKMEGRDAYLPEEIWRLFPDRLVESELGEVPEGWNTGPFGDVTTEIRSKTNPFSVPDQIFHHYSIPAFDRGAVPDEELGIDIKSAKTRVRHGSVLLCRLNPDIERVWLTDVRNEENAVCSTEFMVLEPKPVFTRSYLYCLSRALPFRQTLGSLVTGTSKSHQRSPGRAVLAIEVLIPPTDVIRAFDRLISPKLELALASLRVSTSISASRDALLTKLLFGEVDLLPESKENDVYGR